MSNFSSGSFDPEVVRIASYHILRCFDISLEPGFRVMNPALAFLRRAQDGEYEKISDEEYAERLAECERLSAMWGGQEFVDANYLALVGLAFCEFGIDRVGSGFTFDETWRSPALMRDLPSAGLFESNGAVDDEDSDDDLFDEDDFGMPSFADKPDLGRSPSEHLREQLDKIVDGDR